jgi:hypothetical protein
MARTSLPLQVRRTPSHQPHEERRTALASHQHQHRSHPRPVTRRPNVRKPLLDSRLRSPLGVAGPGAAGMSLPPRAPDTPAEFAVLIMSVRPLETANSAPQTGRRDPPRFQGRNFHHRRRDSGVRYACGSKDRRSNFVPVSQPHSSSASPGAIAPTARAGRSNCDDRPFDAPPFSATLNH